MPNRDVEPTSDMASSAPSGEDWTVADDGDVASPASNHHMRIYQSYLGVGLTGSAVLRRGDAGASANEHVFTTDSILQLMQNALQNIVNSVSPTAKPTMEAFDAARKEESPASPHVFDQQELFVPLLKLVRSDMKDRTLTGMLEMLNACGHLISSGWPLILAAVQEACEIGDAKTQVLAFKCLRLIVDDLVVSIPSSYLPDCIKCIGRFGSRAKDVNISLTAVNELWSVADVIGKQKARQESDPSKRKQGQWGYIFAEFSSVALNERAEVRNSSINTLFGTAVTYGAQFELSEWQLFINSTVLPLAAKLCETQRKKSLSGREKDGAKVGANYMLHHSRDNAEKQWNESRVLMLTGISRVLETNWHYLLQHSSWFSTIWRELLQHVALNAAFGMPKEVVLASVKTLQTLLQVSSAGDFDHIAQSQPVRAGVGMRVVGGALVSSSTPTSAASTSPNLRRATSAPVYRDPALWEEAFSQLLLLCDQRQVAAEKDKNPVLPWIEDEEQEIASTVVSVLVALYMQAKDYEFKDLRNVEKMLDLFAVLITRHVLGTPAIGNGAVTKAITNITTNSLQSRVLNAFEECESFASHPDVHTKVLDQLVGYVTQSSTKDLVFFTRHALTSLAKLYASVSKEAKEKRFLSVLFCIQPFLKFDDGLTTPESSPSPSPEKPMTAAQKAATQLWKHALRVLLVVISSGLVAVRLAEACWRPLLETIAGFVQPNGGKFPSCVQSEEDEVLVLSVLECVVDSTIALLSDGNDIKSHVGQQYNAFIGDLVAVLCSGIDAVEHNKAIIRCCVRQLTTMCIQMADQELASFARARLVACCNTALVRFADLDSSAGSRPPSPPSKADASERDVRLTSFSSMGALSGSNDPQLVQLPRESVVRSVPLPAAAKRAGPILAFPDNAFARELFAQVGTPVMVAEEAEITKLTGITALISFFYATCDTTQQWCVNNGVGASAVIGLLLVAGGQASRDYIASFFHALATAGAESSEGFGDTADEAATPGGLNEHVHRSLHGNGGYGLVADQLDAIFWRLSGTDADPARRPMTDWSSTVCYRPSTRASWRLCRPRFAAPHPGEGIQSGVEAENALAHAEDRRAIHHLQAVH
ncbi:hypothetical protein ON010_g9434 [Phytophthora cinnamomi]|nr:hypothetical protein ON010_g9434 [Phytophthora cinnamomi]